MSQLMRFPAGKFDDAVDVCSLIGRGLEYARPPVVKPPIRDESIPAPAPRNDGCGWMS
jgi:hypothetical protein